MEILGGVSDHSSSSCYILLASLSYCPCTCRYLNIAVYIPVEGGIRTSFYVILCMIDSLYILLLILPSIWCLYENRSKRCFSSKGDLKVGIIGAGRIGQVIEIYIYIYCKYNKNELHSLMLWILQVHLDTLANVSGVKVGSELLL